MLQIASRDVAWGSEDCRHSWSGREEPVRAAVGEKSLLCQPVCQPLRELTIPDPAAVTTVVAGALGRFELERASILDEVRREVAAVRKPEPGTSAPRSKAAAMPAQGRVDETAARALLRRVRALAEEERFSRGQR